MTGDAPNLLDAGDFDARRTQIAVPEGVELTFEIASRGDRVVAFLVDALGLVLALLVLLLLGTIVSSADEGLGTSILLLGVFLLRNAWWTLQELRRGGTTIGKRKQRLRVVDARGGALRPLALVIRNLTRELELMLPLTVLIEPTALVSSGPYVVRVLASLWVFAFLLAPLIDSKSRRLGDLLAGTLVIREPYARLRADLVDARAEPAKARYRFTQAQLEHYGIYELQVLEKLLREEPRRSKTLDAVADRIATKIEWPGPPPGRGTAREFLSAFYRAQRERLEHDLSLGRARSDKEDDGGRSS